MSRDKNYSDWYWKTGQNQLLVEAFNQEAMLLHRFLCYKKNLSTSGKFKMANVIWSCHNALQNPLVVVLYRV